MPALDRVKKSFSKYLFILVSKSFYQKQYIKMLDLHAHFFQLNWEGKIKMEINFGIEK